jgi:hypothetical protein
MRHYLTLQIMDITRYRLLMDNPHRPGNVALNKFQQRRYSMDHKPRMVCSIKPIFRIMIINKQIFVAYYRNGRLISKQQTNNPHGYLMELRQQGK